jgi:putative addiction module component (TIGR02574 family)
MSQTITAEEIAAAEAESAVLQLPRDARARIAARLLESLEEETRVERAWAEEIGRRVAEYRAGKARVRPIEEVLDEVDELLR